MENLFKECVTKISIASIPRGTNCQIVDYEDNLSKGGSFWYICVPVDEVETCSYIKPFFFIMNSQVRVLNRNK